MLTHLQPKTPWGKKKAPGRHIPAVTPISSSQTHVAAADISSRRAAGAGRCFGTSPPVLEIPSSFQGQCQLILGMIPLPLSLSSAFLSLPRLLLPRSSHRSHPSGWVQEASFPSPLQGWMPGSDKDPLAPGRGRERDSAIPAGGGGIICHQDRPKSPRAPRAHRLGTPGKGKINIKTGEN